jgi:Amino acid transporters
VLGSLHGHHGRELTAATGSSLHGFALLSGIGFAMISVLWAYEGWQFGTYSAGEVKDPQRSFPRAFLLGSLLLAGLYLFAVVAYLVALGPSVAATSDTIAAAAATTSWAHGPENWWLRRFSSPRSVPRTA